MREGRSLPRGRSCLKGVEELPVRGGPFLTASLKGEGGGGLPHVLCPEHGPISLCQILSQEKPILTDRARYIDNSNWLPNRNDASSSSIVRQRSRQVNVCASHTEVDPQ